MSLCAGHIENTGMQKGFSWKRKNLSRALLRVVRINWVCTEVTVALVAPAAYSWLVLHSNLSHTSSRIDGASPLDEPVMKENYKDGSERFERARVCFS